MSYRFEKVSDVEYIVDAGAKRGMKVPLKIFANETLLQKMTQDKTIEQGLNVATLPGIYRYSIILPDGHEGYGFPIGGVAAFDIKNGVVSPGGVGYDINCGVRLLLTNLSVDDVKPVLRELLDEIFRNVPSGLGSEGKLRMSFDELDSAVSEGVNWAIRRGYGWKEDAEFIEEKGCLHGADPSKVSVTAKRRGLPQLGSLGSGNHFLEIDYVERIMDEDVAKAFGIEKIGQIVVLIHTGSRGYGHQICSDYLKVMEAASRKYNIWLPDRELAAVPVESPEAKNYFAAMACAVNYAFLNRQVITHWVRESFTKVFKKEASEFGLHVLYDVAHNIAKIEEHRVNGERKMVVVHRKGATRSFPPGSEHVPSKYIHYGQPVLIPGSMGSASWVLIGTEKAMELSFGSTAHGAGRMLSRNDAMRKFTSRQIRNMLEERGVYLRVADINLVAEEAPGAYKDPDLVVDVTHKAGISRKVARLVPLGVVKG
ncbi:MAG: RtcB family protein [Thermoproteota archaeon]